MTAPILDELLTQSPLPPPRPHRDAILPGSPTVRVAPRGHEDDVLLAYYHMPPLDPTASVHVIDRSFELAENRIPFQESLCWPDEEGVLHFGSLQDGQAMAQTDETPARFFELTDRFASDGRLPDDAFYVVAALSYPVAAASAGDPDIHLISEDGAALDLPYSLEAEPITGGAVRVKVYAPRAVHMGQSVWAEYRAVDASGHHRWVREPLRFRSVYADARLGWDGPTYTLMPYPDGSGYRTVIGLKGQEVADGAALMWRIRGTAEDRTVWTGWFSDWVSSEESPKLLAEESIDELLRREHPGAGSPVIESVTLWGGSVNVYADSLNRPVAAADAPRFAGAVPEGYDYVTFPHRGTIFVSPYTEQTEADVTWRLTVHGKRLEVSPGDGSGGHGDGLWEIKEYVGGNLSGTKTVRDWDYTGVSTGIMGGLHLYSRMEPPNYFYITARIYAWVPYRAMIQPLVANDDDITIRINGEIQYERGSTGAYVFPQGYIYNYFPANLWLQAGWNEIHITVRDRGNNILTHDRTALDWDRSLHQLLQDVYGDHFWIGTGVRPETVDWTTTLTGTVRLTYGDPPHVVTPDPYTWPNFSVTFLDAQASGFPFLDVRKSQDFTQSGVFSITVTGPDRQTRSGSKSIPVSAMHTQGPQRLASFADLVADLNLVGVEDPAKTFVEAWTDNEMISVRFSYTEGGQIRRPASPDGTPRISVAELLAHLDDGWLIAWTKVPKRRIAPRLAFRTQDASRIFVLPMSAYRTPEGVLPAWQPRVRPGRFVRRMPVPYAVSTRRYDLLPVLGGLPESQEIIWTYELPEYDRLAFLPAPPYRRVHVGMLALQTGNRLLLPHPKLAPDPDLHVQGLRDADIAWVDPNTGQASLRLRPDQDGRIGADYIATEDAYPYAGYPTDLGWMHLDLNASRYHTFATDENGEIPGHFERGHSLIEQRPGTQLLGKALTLYLLPAKAELVRFEKRTEVTVHQLSSPSVLAQGSQYVDVYDGALQLAPAAMHGVAYLKPLTLPFAARVVRIAGADDMTGPQGQIIYEIFDGSGWQVMPKGQYVLLPKSASSLQVRITLDDPGAFAWVRSFELEAIGIEEQRTVLAEWTHTLYHTTLPPEELAADPLAVPLATLYVSAHISPQDITLIDARKRGGGIAAKFLPRVPEELLGGYWDLGFWDGRAHLENGVLIVELPASLLDRYGGKLSHDAILKKLHRHVAFGHMIIVRYRGEDGTWINS